MSTLKDRCRDFIRVASINAILRQHDPVEELTAFVIAEQGRAADPRLESYLPLCLYFESDTDRADFISAIHAAKPGMSYRKVR